MKTDVMTQKSNTINCPICGRKADFDTDTTEEYWFDNDTGLLLIIDCKVCREYRVEAVRDASGEVIMRKSVKEFFDSLDEDERAFISQMTQRAMDYDGWWLHWSQKMLQNILNDRRYAYEAITRWGLHDGRIEHHGIGCDILNLLFYVITDDGRFTIRIYRPSARFAEVRSMVYWLRVLRAEASVPVLEPVPTPGGSFIEQVSIKDLPPRYCVLYNWIEADQDSANIGSPLTPKMYEQIGEYLAKIHRHSESFNPPEWFGGYRNNKDAMRRWLKKIFDWRKDESHPDVQAMQKGLQLMEELGETSDVFGLVHGETQIMFREGELVGATDFLECSWSYYVANIAGKLRWLGESRSFDDDADLFNSPECQALMAGYERIRPLPKPFEESCKIFLDAIRVGWDGSEAEWFQVGQQG